MPYARTYAPRTYARRKPSAAPKRNYRRSVARPVSKAVKQQIERTVKRHEEKKWFYTPIQGAWAVNQCWLDCTDLTNTSQSLGQIGRIGDFIDNVSVTVKVVLPLGVPAGTCFRAVLVQPVNQGFTLTGDTYAGGDASNAATVTRGTLWPQLSMDPGTFDPQSNYGQKTSVKVLKSKWIYSGSQPTSMRAFTMTAKIGKVKYTSGATQADRPVYFAISIFNPEIAKGIYLTNTIRQAGVTKDTAGDAQGIGDNASAGFFGGQCKTIFTDG